MSQPYSTRDDLKGDFLQEKIQSALEWIASHRQQFFSAVGTVAAVLVVAVFIVINFRNLRKQAWEKYNMGQTWAVTNNPDKAVETFNDVASNFAKTPAAQYALIGKGDVLYRQKKYPEAIESYKQCVAKNPPKSVLPFALAGLGAAQEDSGDFTGAIETFKQFTSNYPDHILAPKMYEALARNYELTKNLDAAKEIYEKIITMFPETFWSEKARGRYQAISPQAFGQSPQSAQGTPSSPK